MAPWCPVFQYYHLRLPTFKEAGEQELWYMRAVGASVMCGCVALVIAEVAAFVQPSSCVGTTAALAYCSYGEEARTNRAMSCLFARVLASVTRLALLRASLPGQRICHWTRSGSTHMSDYLHADTLKASLKKLGSVECLQGACCVNVCTTPEHGNPHPSTMHVLTGYRQTTCRRRPPSCSGRNLCDLSTNVYVKRWTPSHQCSCDTFTIQRSRLSSTQW